MRLVFLLLGVVLGVVGTLAYATFTAPSLVSSATLPRDPQITVILGDRFVAELVRYALVETYGARDLELDVELQDDTMVIRLQGTVLGGTAAGSTTLRPFVERGTLAVDVVETSLGRLPIPGLEQLLQRQIDQRLRSLLAGLPVTITGARVERSRGFVITCRIDLAAVQLGDSFRSQAAPYALFGSSRIRAVNSSP